MAKKSRVDRIALAGGLIGMLTTNPRRAIESRVEEANSNGWRLHQILPHSERNLFVILLASIVLILTLGLYTFGGGYLLLFEKDE